MTRPPLPASLLVLAAVLGGVVWLNVQARDPAETNMALQCHRLYAEARSAADSARIDAQVLGGGRDGHPPAPHHLSCGAFRHLERQLADSAAPRP